MEKLLVAILLPIFVILIGIPFAILNGWVLSWLWLWFLVPFGLPAIGLVHAIGVSTVVGFMTKQYVPNKDGHAGEAYTFMILFPLASLAIGYIVHSFM